MIYWACTSTMRDKKMPNLRQFALSAIFLALITLAIFDTASAAGFNQFIGFGDSNLDTGYLRYHKTGNTALDQSISAAIADGAKGGFAGNGVMCSTLLAKRFGLNAAPIGGGGSNYAIGASFAAIDKSVLVSAVQQIRNYLSTVNGAANPKALYVIKSGDNDLSHVSKQDAAWNAANPDYLSQQASALASEIKVLQSAGARIIIVPNSMYYAIPDAEDPNSAETYARSVEYGANLWSDLSTKKVTFIPADIDSLVKYIVHNPKVFGFTDASVLPVNSPSPVSALVAIIFWQFLRLKRESHWTQSVAVGDKEFLQSVKKSLNHHVHGRSVESTDSGRFQLREAQTSYGLKSFEYPNTFVWS